MTLGVSLKLYLDIERSRRWAQAVGEIARRHPAVLGGAVRLFALPSLPALSSVRRALEGAAVAVGAQDLHWDDRGPFTGAVSGADLAAIGCTLVEVGHAERRRLFCESDDVVQRKVVAAVRNGLTPVLCIGEDDLASPSSARDACRSQLESALGGLGAAARAELIVAYEPVWAIGQPRPADPEHILAVVDGLRSLLSEDIRVQSSSVIYGGSAQPGLLTELGTGVDGLFLGRFAHDPQQLEEIIDEADRLSWARLGEG